MKIKEMNWIEEFVGFEVELQDGRSFGIQFEIQTNNSSSDYNTHMPILVDLEDACFSPRQLSDEEMRNFLEGIWEIEKVKNKALELDKAIVD